MRIRFHGPVLRPERSLLEEVEAAPPKGTVEDLLTSLGYSSEHRKHILVLVQGKRLRKSDPIPGDATDLMVMVPVGGG